MRKRAITARGRRIVSVLAAAATVLALTACTGGGSNPTGDGDTGSGTDGVIDKITIRLQEPVAEFDPAINVGNATTQTRILIQGQLYRLDFEGEPQPDLVESATVSDDGLTQTMTLHSGLQYSDGTPVVAEDVVTMYRRSVLEREGGNALFTPFVEKVEAPDDVTVVFHLLQPYAQLPLALAMGELGIHPTDAMESDPDYFDAPVSAGPYIVEDFTAGDQVMHLVENPDYVKGPLKVKAIDAVVVTDITQAALQLTSGQLDLAWGLPFSAVESAEAVDGVEVLLHPTGGVFQLGVNPTKGGALGDPTVRQAMQLAIDRDEISQKAWLGHLEPNPAWVFATSPYFSVAVPNDGKPDIAEAQRLMDSTDYADGFDITIDTFGAREGHTATVTLLREQLGEIGINVTVNPLEIPTALERLNDNTFEGFFQGSVAPSAASVLVVDNCPSGVWGRWMPTGNPTICELAVQAMGEADPQATLDEAQSLAADAMTIIPLVNRRDAVGTRIAADVFGPVKNTPWLAVASAEGR